MKSISPLALLLAATCFAAPALAAPADAPNPAFTGSDLFNLSAASDAQISPDGRQLAYVRKSADIMTDKARSAIWLVNVATGKQRPLAAGTGDHFSPRWSPDGRRLAYASSAEAARRSSSCAGWIRARACASPALPTARRRSPGRPTAAASPI